MDAVTGAVDLVLVVNVGSSSLRVDVLDAGNAAVDSAHLADADDAGRAELLAKTIDAHPEIDAVGHRIVHGGPAFTAPTRLTSEVVDALDDLSALAPLHNPPAIKAVRQALELAPHVPHVACFDTMFHATIPPEAHRYAIPERWHDEVGVRRYGFHGLSHAWAAARGAELIGRPLDELRTVTCHLGAGASLCAVLGGRSIDTTMGFTPLEGLVMRTRSGDVDPGALLYVQEHLGLAAAEVRDALEHRSGLLALAGTPDLAEVERMAADGSERALLALAVHHHRLRAGIAAMAASLGGVDLVVFTGGAGEHSVGTRQAACDGLAFLGIEIDAGANARGAGDDEVVSTPASRVAVAVVHAREDITIADETRKLLRSSNL